MKNRGIKYVLFDFDGTLADTLPLIFKAMIHVFKNYDNKELSNEHIVSMFGPTEEKIIRKHLVNAAQMEPAVAAFYQMYEQEHESLVSKSNEIEQMLNRLKDLGFKLGVYTGKGRKSLDISLKLLGLESMFDVTISGDEVKNPKPDPEGVNKALHSLGATAVESIFIGDSDADIQAGQTAGVRTIGVQWLSTFQTHQFNVTPYRLFLHPHELLAHLLDA
jgi:phosphoglycolate phosphatase/pyrophosphatase PpaX